MALQLYLTLDSFESTSGGTVFPDSSGNGRNGSPSAALALADDHTFGNAAAFDVTIR